MRRRLIFSKRPTALLVAVVSMLSSLLVLFSGTARAGSYVPISGAGSTWSQNAINQWVTNVQQYGLAVNYEGTGSSDGRTQFKNGTVDFSASEIPYGLTDGGVVDTPPARHYAYMPDVAGGTSFMYNLTINGQRVTNLRLSGLNLAKIFTGVITNWADPAIAADNPGITLPPRQIVPVVRSDGSGTTAQFTLWLSKQYPDLWNAYCAKAGLPTPCGLVSEFPVLPGTSFTAQSGSTGSAGFVAQAQNVGTINYVEYSYALDAGFPVAKVLNKAGYYTEPTAPNVAVALLQSQINTDPASPQYLTQQLDGVYNDSDPRTYPLSSYSYMIVPTVDENGFTDQKGASLGAFAYYFLCEGQQQAPVLGYSPLPVNLVKAGLDQVKRIPGVDVQSIDISKCNNPTFSADGSNTLATTAPQPQPCDMQGQSQCATGTGGDKDSTTTRAVATSAGAAAVSGPAASSSGKPTGATTSAKGSTTAGKSTASPTGASQETAVTGAASGTSAAGSSGSAATSAAGSTQSVSAAAVTDPSAGGSAQDPSAGVSTTGTTASGDGVTSATTAVAAVPTTLANGSADRGPLEAVAILLLLGLVIAPPLVSRRLSASRQR